MVLFGESMDPCHHFGVRRWRRCLALGRGVARDGAGMLVTLVSNAAMLQSAPQRGPDRQGGGRGFVMLGLKGLRNQGSNHTFWPHNEAPQVALQLPGF